MDTINQKRFRKINPAILIIFFLFTYAIMYFRFKNVVIGYSIIYLLFALLISVFYIFEDAIFTQESTVKHEKILMQKSLFNPKGEFVEKFSIQPIYSEFVVFNLKRNSEDPYGARVIALEAIHYKNNVMLQSLFIPIKKDIRGYMPLSLALKKFYSFAGDLPVILYNQPFTYTYLNIKLNKEVHFDYVDTMKIAKDIYGKQKVSVADLSKFLNFRNLKYDNLRDSKTIGAIYLDYINTINSVKKKEKKVKLKEERKERRTQKIEELRSQDNKKEKSSKKEEV